MKWISNPDSYSLVFNKVSFKKAIKNVPDNCCFQFGSKVFQQVIGIPLVSDPASFMGNHFLFYYEDKWIRKNKRKDLIQARKFTKMFQFIDDLAVINDGGVFEKVYHKIYPLELELKHENRLDTEASLLDLHIKFVNKICNFSSILYHKGDSFPFSIVRTSYL